MGCVASENFFAQIPEMICDSFIEKKTASRKNERCR